MYHQKHYGLLNFNQLDRIISEKTIVNIGDNLMALAYAVDIVIHYVANKKYTVVLGRILNELNRLVA